MRVSIRYEECCWVSPIKNPNTGNARWKMVARVNLNPRISDNEINRSPVTSTLRAETYHRGCNYKLRIPGETYRVHNIAYKLKGKAN